MVPANWRYLWFQRAKDIDQWIMLGKPYLIYGKLQDFRGKYNIVHPEIEELSQDKTVSTGLEPVYSSSEKLVVRGLDSKGRRKIVKATDHADPTTRYT